MIFDLDIISMWFYYEG